MRREWRTESGRAHFLVAPRVDDGTYPEGDDVLMLMTLRSHDQYNTTIYGLDDRYRGVFGRRDIVFMHEADLAAQGIVHGDLVDVTAVTAIARSHVVRGLTAIAFDIPRGCVAAYYPETNGLIALSHYDRRSGTPAYKGTPVRVAKGLESTPVGAAF
jgi:anaerobic selenocysteine-containing dehydrogenase